MEMHAGMLVARTFRRTQDDAHGVRLAASDVHIAGHGALGLGQLGLGLVGQLHDGLGVLA